MASGNNPQSANGWQADLRDLLVALPCWSLVRDRKAFVEAALGQYLAAHLVWEDDAYTVAGNLVKKLRLVDAKLLSDGRHAVCGLLAEVRNRQYHLNLEVKPLVERLSADLHCEEPETFRPSSGLPDAAQTAGQGSAGRVASVGHDHRFGHSEGEDMEHRGATPRIFISYSHDTTAHRERVLSLSERLRADGIETRLDRYVNGTPAEGWPRWMLNQIDWAEFVLLVCTETCYRRFRGHEEPGKGKGVDWEGAVITQKIYDARGATIKFVPVLFDATDERFIPEPVRGHTFYVLNSEQAYQDLCDFLLGQAGVESGPVGEPKWKQRVHATPLVFGVEGGGQGHASVLDPSNLQEILLAKVESGAREDGGRNYDQGPSIKTLTTPPAPAADRYTLTLELVRSASGLTVHSHRHAQVPPLAWTWTEVETRLGTSPAALGDALFDLLFGDETRWEPLLRAVFGYPAVGPRPNPTRGGVRLRICSREPLFLSQPWARLSWEGERLLDHRWEIVTGSDLEPARACVTMPAGDFLIVAPEAGMSQRGGPPGAPMAALIDELWPRPEGAPKAACVVRQPEQLDAALQGMRPQGIYLSAAFAAEPAGPAVLLDGAAGPSPYPLSRLRSRLENMQPPPQVLILDLANLPSGEMSPARLALALSDRIPLILWRGRAGADAGGDRILLAGLRRWLGEGEDPVAAFHAVLREGAPSLPAAGAGSLAIHANYRTWQTETARRSRIDPPPCLALDRDMQKALVTRSLGDLVRSQAMRVMTVLPYGSRENLLAELSGQLSYELDLTAADWAAIAWERLSLPDDRRDLGSRLSAHMAEVLQAAAGERLPHLLRRKGPRGLAPGIRGVLWLDWGVLDNSEPARAWPKSDELEGWLAFCSEELAVQCPEELRIVCFLAIELPEAKYAGLTSWLDQFQRRPWYRRDRFRFLRLPPLGRVDADHLGAYLGGIQTGLDQDNRADLVDRIERETGGNFKATVDLLEEGRNGRWLALLQRLRAGQGKESEPWSETL